MFVNVAVDNHGVLEKLADQAFGIRLNIHDAANSGGEDVFGTVVGRGSWCGRDRTCIQFFIKRRERYSATFSQVKISGVVGRELIAGRRIATATAFVFSQGQIEGT
jgi:hypothetical protein